MRITQSVKILFILMIAAFSQAVSFCDEAEITGELKSDIPRFRQITESFYCGGQPSDASMELLRELGIKTIVSFRNDKKIIKEEREIAESLGLNYISMPWSSYDMPKQEYVDRFLNLVTDDSYSPVFVHCKKGKDRTGVMLACYRIREEGWSTEKALRELKKNGSSPLTHGHLRLFVADFAESESSDTSYEENVLAKSWSNFLYYVYKLRKAFT